VHLTFFTHPSSLNMPPHSRFESLPAEVLSGILTRCSRDDLVNLAQTCNSLCAVCRQELINYPLTMKVTPDNLKCWAAYFRKGNNPFTRGARSLDIMLYLRRDFGAFGDVDPAVFDMNAQPIHPDASRIFPLPSSLRRLSLTTLQRPNHILSSDIPLLLLRSLPERCPRLEELTFRANPKHLSDDFDRCIRRLTHLRKLHFHVWNPPGIPNRLSLLPASLTDLYLRINDIQTQEEVAATVPWVRRIRKLSLEICAPQGIANVLMILSRGGASQLTELILNEDRSEKDPATMIPLREALTAGFQEFSFLQPPLHTLSLANPSAWLDSLHLPLLHTAVASTLTQLSLRDVDSCIFPSHLPWPRLQSLEFFGISKMGYQGPLTEPIFPVLTAISMFDVGEIQAPEDLFPALKMIKWQTAATPEQVASLVRHDIKRIGMTAHYGDDPYEPLWEAMGGHTIELIALQGRFPDGMKELAKNGERIFPGFPNIREFAIDWY
jgi:hypothetical protein